ncbi:MAG: cyclic lactone autoinducer peptide [Oscillospiraceae bacterium]|nr:cyclic lactone autoinducer peptide [Oscillospiraceae bacterium]
MKLKKRIAELTAGLSMASAKNAYSKVTAFGMYQPKEPKCLDKLVKK